MFKIPFGWLPAHWGTAGKNRERLKAEYELNGEDLDRRLSEIEYEKESLDLDISMIEIDLKYKKLNEIEAEKKIATLKGEPWVGTVSSEYKINQGTDGFSFELDWNNAFVEMLRDSGYDGLNDDLVVEAWFEDVTKNELVDLVTEDSEEEEDYSIPKTRTTKETIDDDGTEKKRYS